LSVDWKNLILESSTPSAAWADIFSALLSIARQSTSPVTLHDATVYPDRLLAEAAWELWRDFPKSVKRTSAELIRWTGGKPPALDPEIGEKTILYLPPHQARAVLIIDALSLRELPILLSAAANRNIQPLHVGVTGSECPSTTDHFAKAIGLPSRSAMANNTKPATFALFSEECYTDVVSMPYEDCAVSSAPNVVIWHSWLDDFIHQNKQPDFIASSTATAFKSDGFWNFVDRLRKGRKLVITSDHGYAAGKLFSSEVADANAIDILRTTFGASRNTAATQPWQKSFMPPIVMTHNKQHVIMGQRKWKVQGGFPNVCHGGMSLLEVAVPWIELGAL
jgi:hypothetical protein